MAKAAPAPLDSSLLGVPKGAAAPAVEVSPIPPQRPPPAQEPRTALTVRLPVNTQERLREASHRLRREKQALVDEALIHWLEQQGF